MSVAFHKPEYGITKVSLNGRDTGYRIVKSLVTDGYFVKLNGKKVGYFGYYGKAKKFVRWMYGE